MSGERFIQAFVSGSNDFDLLKLDDAWCLRHKRYNAWTLASGAKHMSFTDACEMMKKSILKRMFKMDGALLASKLVQKKSLS